MRRILHRVLSLCLTLSLCAGLLALPAAASGSSAESTDRADKLASLHLFQGTEQTISPVQAGFRALSC